MVDTLERVKRHPWRRRRSSGTARPLELPKLTPVPAPAPEPEHPRTADMSAARHPWMPLSPCGSDCLPAAGAVPTVGWGRRVVRGLAASAVMVGGVSLALCLPMLPAAARTRATRRWFRLLLRSFGIELRVPGEDDLGNHDLGVAGRGALVAANHVSWLDVVALNAVCPVRFLAKREIRSWPIVGRLAASGGTVFVDRERLTELPRTVDTLSEVLRGGGQITVFPEGTTWCGTVGGRWRPAAFQAAIDAEVPVVPVALRYGQLDLGPSTAVAFVGEMTLVNTLCRTLALRGLVIEVDVRPVLSSHGRTRRDLADAAAAAATAVTGDSGGRLS